MFENVNGDEEQRFLRRPKSETPAFICLLGEQNQAAKMFLTWWIRLFGLAERIKRAHTAGQFLGNHCRNVGQARAVYASVLGEKADKVDAVFFNSMADAIETLKYYPKGADPMRASIALIRDSGRRLTIAELHRELQTVGRVIERKHLYRTAKEMGLKIESSARGRPARTPPIENPRAVEQRQRTEPYWPFQHVGTGLDGFKIGVDWRTLRVLRSMNRRLNDDGLSNTKLRAQEDELRRKRSVYMESMIQAIREGDDRFFRRLAEGLRRPPSPLHAASLPLSFLTDKAPMTALEVQQYLKKYSLNYSVKQVRRLCRAFQVTLARGMRGRPRKMGHEKHELGYLMRIARGKLET